MIDLKALRQQVDLLALVSQSTALRRVAASGGGEWAGPCPFCGGRDRFHVQPQAPGGGRWLCRACTEGRWQDALEYGKRLWPGLPFREVCQRLAGGRLPEARQAAPTPAPALPPYAAPPGDWQTWAAQAIHTCQRLLWEESGAPALDFLQRRGLQQATLRHWRLGYSPGARFGGLWVPRGVLIPCEALGQIWYLKVALLPGQEVQCERCGQRCPARRPCPACGAANKYRGVRGNRTAAIFGADELRGASLALFVEGEFDALIAWQELHDVLAVCTIGGASNRLDQATWGPFLLPLEQILATYDADAAGERGLQTWQALNEAVRPCPLPPGYKDVNEYTLAGGELWPWLKEKLLDPGQANGEAACAPPENL